MNTRDCKRMEATEREAKVVLGVMMKRMIVDLSKEKCEIEVQVF